jgi:glycerophosphoryl diester phosphodiesterase
MLASALTPDPLLVAHRAGNDLARLRAARDLEVDVIEADVHLWGGALEVRHMKRLGPLRMYWDRRELYRGDVEVPRLEDLLEAARPDVRLLLDLKGVDPRLPGALEWLLRTRAPDRVMSVCARNWRLLARFRAMDQVDVVHSVGNERQLRRVRRLLAAGEVDAVSIDQRLLTPAVAAELTSQVSRVWAWTVNSVPEMQRLRAWGIGGLITDHPAALKAGLAA